jgi:hypothetical protein
VQHVPTAAEVENALRSAGFASLLFESLKPVTCLHVDGAELHEMRVNGWRSADASANCQRRVLYKGPLAQVTGEDGTVYRRGAIATVAPQTWEQLKQGPAAAQFAFLSDENPG